MSAKRKEGHYFIARQRPKEYPATETQVTVKDAAEFCGIQKGMPRAELREAMRECIPRYWKLRREMRERGDV